MPDHRPITKADVDNAVCPLSCPHLYDYRGSHSWSCEVCGPLADNYDMGATSGPNIPYKGGKCPLFAEYHAQPLQCLRELHAAFAAHEADVCVVGNVRAGDAVDTLRFALEELFHV